MNYSKIINNLAFVALLAAGAFFGFMIGVKLPAMFSSTAQTASVAPTVFSNIKPIELVKEVAKVKDEPVAAPIKPFVKPAAKIPVTVGPKTETFQSLNPSAPVKDVGKPDLAVEILGIGVVDKVSNVWTATTSLRSTDRIAVRFSVENLGTRETGSWYFNAVLPTYPSHIYSANSQASLLPGDRIEFTLGFDSVEKKDGNFVVINVDPANSIFEASEDNNIARVTIDGVSF